MTPQAIAIAAGLIREYEGCSYGPYRDPAGYWTIAWGCRFLADGKPVTADTPPLTQAQADALLAAHLAPLAADVGAMLPAGATDGQAAALLDFAWNLGPGALRRSTLLKLFLAGDVDGAARQFAAWVFAGGKKLPGLVARRAAERALFVGGPKLEQSGDQITGKSQSSADFPAGTPREEITADALNAAELRSLA